MVTFVKRTTIAHYKKTLGLWLVFGYTRVCVSSPFYKRHDIASTVWYCVSRSAGKYSTFWHLSSIIAWHVPIGDPKYCTILVTKEMPPPAFSIIQNSDFQFATRNSHSKSCPPNLDNVRGIRREFRIMNFSIFTDNPGF